MKIFGNGLSLIIPSIWRMHQRDGTKKLGKAMDIAAEVTRYIQVLVTVSILVLSNPAKGQDYIPAEPLIPKPPELSVEVKRLINGLLAIRQSDTLLFDQKGIEETLGVNLIDRKPYKEFAQYAISGLPPHLTGKYELRPVVKGLIAELTIYLDTYNVCAHLPQVHQYIGIPYGRQVIPPPSGGEVWGPDVPAPPPHWPGVEDGVARFYHFLKGDNPSKIRPSFILYVHGIRCVRAISIETLLIKPEAKE